MSDKIYRGPYAQLPCKHCGKVLEAGPMSLANWAYCHGCASPVHDKRGCNNFCPKVGKWDPRREEAKILYGV